MPAQAQENTTDILLEEIIVTASRRATPISDLPQAISALSGDVIRNTQATGLQDVFGYVPSVDMQYFGPGQSRITVRGISPDEQTGVSTVSYYIDEVAITSPNQTGQPDVSLYDIRRVEFLRGPQGTLYGEGAMGGTIRVITNEADPKDFAGSVRLTGSAMKDGDESYGIDGMLNIPIVRDVLALRLVGTDRHEGGWIDQTLVRARAFTPPPARYVATQDIKDANSSDTTNIRAQARFTPTDALSVDLTYTHNKTDVDTINIASDGDTHTDLSLRPTSDRYTLWAGTVSYDFGAARLVSATSRTQRTSKRRDPQEPFLVAASPATDYVDSYTVDQVNDGQVVTEELRLVSSDEGRLRWTVGGFYRDGSGGSVIQQTYVASLLNASMVNAYDYRSDFRSRALFGEADYDVTEALTLTVGGRVFDERETGPTYVNGALTETLRRKVDDITPRVTLSYDWRPGLMTYATYSQGYRSGGFNRFGSTLGVATSYDPDKTRNYEVGLKYDSDDHKVNLTLSGFYTDWRDMQFIQLDPISSFTYVGNANKASSKGLEAEATWRPVYNLGLSGSLSLTDAQLESDLLGNLTGIIPSGTRLPSAPTYRFSLRADYSTPLTQEWSLDLSAAINGAGASNSKLETGGSYTSIYGQTYPIGSRLPAYQMASLRAAVAREGLSVALFVRNLWNERAIQGNDNFLPIFGQPLYRTPPRTVGVELSASF